jgi:hypothetical protein
MSRYRLAAPAREDSVEIWEFIADESDEARTAAGKRRPGHHCASFMAAAIKRQHTTRRAEAAAMCVMDHGVS